MYLWLIILISLFMLYGLYTWGVYPFDKSNRSAVSSGRRSDTRRTRCIS